MENDYTINSKVSNIVNGDNLFVGTTCTYIFGGEIITESFSFNQNDNGNFIEVIKREKPNPNFWIGNYPHRDRIFKEVYGIARDEKGKKTLQLLKTIEAEVTPGHYVEEKFDFPE